MVRKKAKLEYTAFNIHQQYSETVIQRIVKQLAEATGELVYKIKIKLYEILL
jgi:hypothetical protein